MNAFVLPKFLAMYATHVCPMVPPGACLRTMIVPPLDRQLQIVESFQTAARTHDIRGIEGLVVLDLVRDVPQDALEALLEASDIYHLSLDTLRALTQHAVELFT